MKLNILKNKYLKSGTLVLFGSLLSSLYMNDISYAGKTVPYYFGETSSDYSGFIDPEVPPAVKLTEAVDGMPAGTILYRTQHLDFTYYSPVTPEKLQGTSGEVNSAKYRKWGPWDMPDNQVAYEEKVGGTIVPGFVPSSYTYTSVTIPKGTTVEGVKTNSSGTDSRTTLGTLSSTYTGKIKSVTNYKGINDPHVYFDLSGTNLADVGAVNIGRVPLSKVTATGKINLYYNDSRAIYSKFAKYGRYSDSATKKTNTLTDASHEIVEPGKWVNPSYAPYGLAGLNGEWTYLGYNTDGDALLNPYYISTSLYFRGNADINDYDFRYTPWNPNDTDSQGELKKTEAYQEFPELTKYDTNSKFYDDKYAVIKKLFDDGVLERKKSTLDADIKDMLNRVSFRNHPSNEATVLLAQRRTTTSMRSFTIFNELSDIYLHSMSVTDSSGKEVASYSYDINTGKITRKDGTGIKVGEKYTVKVYLGNAKNKGIIATKNQAQIGIKSDYRAYDSLPIGSVTDVQSKEVNNTMERTKGSKSSALTFTITAPDADFFDIYGYVGYKHLGTDNLDESNDVGRVRMNINGTDYKEQYEYSYADLVAKQIELLDKSGNVVYSYTRGESAPSINKAIVPGTTYNIRYTIVNEGDDAKYRVKSAGHYEGDDWIPGKWGDWVYYDCQVSLDYYHKRIGTYSHGGGNDLVPPYQEFDYSNSVKLYLDGKSNFKIHKGTTITRVLNNIVFENPYLYTKFSFNTNAHANSDKTNDSLETTIQPKFDAVISNVRIFPKNEYITDDTRKTSYLVVYDAKLDTPDFMKGTNIGMLIETSINIGGVTEIFADFLTVGENKNLSHTINDVPIPQTGAITATVILNYHRHTYETNYDNNRGTASDSSIRKVKNPFDGKNTDEATGSDNSDGSSPAGGGSLNNNCLVPRKRNDWSVTHRKLTWSAKEINYTTDDDITNTFKKYDITSDTNLSPMSYYETFNIESVLFRSKVTKDKGLGDDGWVDLLKLSDKDRKSIATVKAGYGFELKIVTKYETNANKTMPYHTTSSDGLSGTYYNNTSKDANISLPTDIFVELPGSGSNRKILSVSGYSGTTKGLLVKETDKSTSSKTVKEFTYTIKSTNTLGIKNSDKIFIPTTLKDGDYKISIYTPPVAGMPSVNKGDYSSLCDRKDVRINVSGSYTDDLNSHTTQ